jgi:hypothetical protein
MQNTMDNAPRLREVILSGLMTIVCAAGLLFDLPDWARLVILLAGILRLAGRGMCCTLAILPARCAAPGGTASATTWSGLRRRWSALRTYWSSNNRSIMLRMPVLVED